MTASMVTARRKGDPQYKTEGKIKCAAYERCGTLTNMIQLPVERCRIAAKSVRGQIVLTCKSLTYSARIHWKWFSLPEFRLLVFNYLVFRTCAGSLNESKTGFVRSDYEHAILNS